jgi:hypothetical protein
LQKGIINLKTLAHLRDANMSGGIEIQTTKQPNNKPTKNPTTMKNPTYLVD